MTKNKTASALSRVMKTTIEEINGKPMTVVWHNPREHKSRHFSHMDLDCYVYNLANGDVIYTSATDSAHIATALPPLPRKPKPEDARLLYRYMAEGIEPHDKCGNAKMQQDYGNAWFTKHEITHAINSETGERVEIAIEDRND